MKYERYCSLELSKLLKVAGYPQVLESSVNWYSEEELNKNEFNTELKEDDVAAPTLSQAANWLLEEKQIYIHPQFVYITDKWLCLIEDHTCGNLLATKNADLGQFNSYNHALEAGIKLALQYIIEEEITLEKSIRMEVINALEKSLKQMYDKKESNRKRSHD